MEIPPSLEQAVKTNNVANVSSSTNTVRPAELLAQLRVGQTILAKVENVLANNQVELRIAKQIVKADSPIQLASGQTIKLIVEDSNNGIILRIAQQANQVETIARALRAALPKQQPVVDVVKQLVETVANNKTQVTNNNAVVQLRAAIQTLIETFPAVKTITQADGLRQAIRDSGVTLEAQLRQAIITGATPRTDNNIKANFLRFAQAALQMQANSTPNKASLTADVARTNTNTGKSNPIDTYNSLLATANKLPLDADKSLSTQRPLLPPLPITTTAAPSNTSDSNRLLASLPTLIQRLFTTPLLDPSQNQPLKQTTVATSATQQSPISQQVFSTMLVDLINQMESGLARIQQQQLSNVTSDDAIRHFLNLELPVFNGKTFDPIGIRLEWEKYQQDENDDNSTQHQWRVTLNFDFDNLGKTQAIIRASIDEINTDFKSESKQSQKLFEKNKLLLEQGLQKHGLASGQLTFSTGHIEAEENEMYNKNLLKTKA